MPELTFDGTKISVPDGTNLVEAGTAAGVPVPIFCYHRSLGAVGACRVCAVTVTDKGRSRLTMACMTTASDGMSVTTLDAHSVEFRRFVIEWLMENHPHDCPICDEGGECQLQDLTIAAGHDHRRFRGPKRTYENQYLGEFIAHEMNRCITCYRCSRFYQDVAGGRDLGAMGSRDRVYFGRFESGPLESPFSGNLVELCPTGVFTDRLFRYRARVWDLEQAASICPHCSVGCNVRPGSRHRELMRVRVRENLAVNGIFLCDRGQFGHRWSEDPARPRVVRMHGQDAGWADAIGIAASQLLDVAGTHGPESVALITSPRASLETHVALRALADGPLAGAHLAHFDDPAREVNALAALRALAAAGGAPLEQSDLEHCDVLLVAGPILVDEAPLAALGVRAAARRGAQVFVLNPGEHYLNDIASVLPVHPGALAGALGDLASVGTTDDALHHVLDAMRGATRAGVLSGGDLVDADTIEAAGRVVQGLGDGARLGFVFPGPNGFGAAALSGGAPGMAGVLDALLAGRLRAAVVVESDLDALGADVVRALSSLELLIVLDHVAGPLADAAHVLLPAATSYESAGMFVNRAGRAQAFAAADVAGEPVFRIIGNDGSFPRQPRVSPPLGDVRPSWWTLEHLREMAVGGAARDLGRLRGELGRMPGWAAVAGLAAGGEGAVVEAAGVVAGVGARGGVGARSSAGTEGGAGGQAGAGARGGAGARSGTGARAGAEVGARHGSAATPVRKHNGDVLALYTCDRVLGSESLSRRSEPVQKMAGPPVARLSPADAERLAVDGSIALDWDGGTLEISARAHRSVAEGVVLVPRDAAWESPPPQGAAVRVRAVAGTRHGGGA